MKGRSVVLAVVALLSAAAATAQTDRRLGEDQQGFLETEWYGYVKLDVAYDGSQTTPGEYAKWAVPEPADDEVTVTLNQTRLGLKLKALGRETGPRAGGRVEVDFYGHVEDPDPRIRHAYFDVSWPEADFDIIIGQTSDVISPLNPSTLNYTVAWWAGNIGFRRPQIRATQRFAVDDGELKVEGALTHNIYDTQVGSVSGEDSGLAVQARVAYSFDRPRHQRVTLGISGHRAEESFPVGAGERSDSWSANLDLSLPLTESVHLKSELFTGKSLAPYLGGAGQGVDFGTSTSTSTRDLHGIHSRGGWLALGIAPRTAIKGQPRVNVGLSIDDVEGEDLADGARELNRSIFGNLIYRLMDRLDVGLELSHWATHYQNRDDCSALRGQLSLIYKL